MLSTIEMKTEGAESQLRASRCNKLAVQLGNAERAIEDYRNQMHELSKQIERISSDVSGKMPVDHRAEVTKVLFSVYEVLRGIARSSGLGTLIYSVADALHAVQNLYELDQDIKMKARAIQVRLEHINNLINMIGKEADRIEVIRGQRELLNCPTPRYR